MFQLIHVMVALKTLLPNVRIPEEPTRKIHGTIYNIYNGVLCILIKGGGSEFLVVHDDMNINEPGSRIGFLVAVIGQEITILARGNEYLGPFKTLPE